MQKDRSAVNKASNLKLSDIILNISFVKEKNDKNFNKKLRESRCLVCYGLVRLPGASCNNCSKIYCSSCIDQKSKDKSVFVCLNKECN